MKSLISQIRTVSPLERALPVRSNWLCQSVGTAGVVRLTLEFGVTCLGGLF